MPRPRFFKLPAEQQETILRVALEEFATHGFNDASLNQIIDTAKISKGSMYYYFDGKEDLYAHVARRELGRLFEGSGPFPVPSADDPDTFWATLEGYYVRILSALVASPKLAALTRDWVAASANPTLQRAQKEMEAATVPWFEQTLHAGQRGGAVRDDVPMSLLLAIVFGLGQAMDVWLLTQRLDEKTLRKLIGLFLGMIRKALSPDPSAGGVDAHAVPAPAARSPRRRR
jgi:AcrR family transcriptional regulator